MECALWLFKDSRRVARRVSYGEIMKSKVVIVVLERGGGWQDHIGVTGGFVECRIERDHKIKLFKCVIDCAAIRRREHRITGTGKHQLDLTLSGCANLISKCRGG